MNLKALWLRNRANWRPRPDAVAVAGVLLCLLGQPPALAQNADPEWTKPEAALLVTQTDSVGSTVWSEVNLDRAKLQRLADAGAGDTALQLWDSTLPVSFTSVETSTGYMRGMGRLVAPATGTFSFVWDGTLFLGVVHEVGVGTVEIVTDAAGAVKARRVDPSALHVPRCATNVQFPDASVPHGGGPSCPHSISTLNGYAADDGSMVDIMFVYTAVARDAAGGVSQIESRIELAITDANNAYQSSAIVPRIRSIHKALIDYTETGQGIILDLPRLTTPGDGFLDSVHADRDTYGADLVSLWVEWLDYGGVAYSMAGLAEEDFHVTGFSVMRQSQYLFNILAHEVGHNFGCDHDRANTGGGALFNYSFGYREPGNLWHDIMAYDPGQVIPYFSNPDLTYNGPPGNPGPIGVPLNQPLPCHNALTHNNTAWHLANYRPAPLTSTPPSRLYVNAAAAPGGDGASWATAIKDLQAGIGKAAAARGAITEIWVAAGTYTPDQGSNNRFRTFKPVQGVTIYGGFAGSETLLTQRNIATNVCTLSGEIGAAGIADNSLHVIDVTDLNATAVLDGFTITAGNANGPFPHDSGGAMRSKCNTATIRNCRFTGNSAAWSCGACLNYSDGNPTFTDCTFTGNTAIGDSAGAVRNDDSNPIFMGCTFSNNSAPFFGAVVNVANAAPSFTNCNFTGNTATHAEGAGGALRNDNSAPTFTGCNFSANVATYSGATEDVTGSTATYTNCTFQNHTASAWHGVSLIAGSSPTFNGCTFASNACVSGGGAIALFDGDGTSILACHFSSNTAGFGGGIYAVNSALTISTSTFTGNTAPTGGGLYVLGDTANVSGCTFTQNLANGGGVGGAIAIGAAAAPNITNCQFIQNDADYTGGAIQNWDSAPVVTSCTFRANTADYGGAVNCDNPGAALFNRNLFVGNIAQLSGGAMQHSFGANSTTVNCVFSGNSTPMGEGAAIHSYGGAAPNIVNCSLSRNSANSNAGGIYSWDATVIVTNCLLWENSGPSGMDQDGQIGGFDSTLTVNYTSLQGSTGSLGGLGNNGSNPQFVDFDGPDNTIGTADDNLRLLGTSAAIDAGNKGALPPGITIDLAGNPRFIDACSVADTGVGTPPLPDRGAYEFLPGGVIPGDTNASGSVTVADIASFVAVMLGTDTIPNHVAAADMNCDALANGRDVRGFVVMLVGP